MWQKILSQKYNTRYDQNYPKSHRAYPAHPYCLSSHLFATPLRCSAKNLTSDPVPLPAVHPEGIFPSH